MDENQKYPQAMFAGLVVDEDNRPLQVATVGGNAHYVVESQGFARHVEAEAIDREVLRWIKEQALANRDPNAKEISLAALMVTAPVWKWILRILTAHLKAGCLRASSWWWGNTGTRCRSRLMP